MAFVPKLTTIAACKVARIDRDRFNEHVAAGRFTCAPNTIPGRARYFDPDDMIALWLFRELMEDGFDADHAGRIACSVAECARLNPDSRAISYVYDYFTPSKGHSMPADQVPAPSDWDHVLPLPGGTDIRKVTTFRIGKLREMIARFTAEEASKIGPED